jgi:hypothetical protein
VLGDPMVEDPRVTFASLVHRYAELIDLGDFQGVADLLGDAELSFEGSDVVCRGRREILSMYERSTKRHGDGTPLTKHVMTNMIAEVDPGGEAGSSRSYFTVFQAVPSVLSLQPVIAGRYRHRYRRTGGRWRIEAMHIIVELTGELGQHLAFDLPESGR